MRAAYSGTEVRAAELPLLDAGVDLMHIAAYGLYQQIRRAIREDCGIGVYGACVVLLIGKGNNGADALYAGARLVRDGASVRAILTAEAGAQGAPTVHQAAYRTFRAAGGRGRQLSESTLHTVCDEAERSDVMVDAILGTGAQGSLRGLAADLVMELTKRGIGAPDGKHIPSEPEHSDPGRRAYQPLVLACDIPSGVNSNSGQVDGPTLTASITVTFGAIKLGAVLPPGSRYAGDVRLVPLGLPFAEPEAFSLDRDDAVYWWPRPAATSHKYTRGVLGVIAGSQQYVGAAVLCAEAALAAGPGMVRYLGPNAVARVMPPEVVSSQAQPNEVHVQAWSLGSGVTADAEQEQRCLSALRLDLPTVVDAGALEVLSRHQDLLKTALAKKWVLTPHAGELATLLSSIPSSNGDVSPVKRSEVEAEPLKHLREAVARTGATVLLKGATTLVLSPVGRLFSVQHGTAWLATAGSGDCLAGITGALLANGVEPDVAAAMAASVHGQAGLIASRDGTAPFSASELPVALGHVLAGSHSEKTRQIRSAD